VTSKSCVVFFSSLFSTKQKGMNAEHSPAEATMHDAVFGGPVFERMRQLGPWAYPDTYVEAVGPLPVHELVFATPPGIDAALESAQTRWSSDFANFEVRALQFLEWGADWAKQQGIPIDSLIQMALQLAWARMHGPPVACYETAHLRIFKVGFGFCCGFVCSSKKTKRAHAPKRVGQPPSNPKRGVTRCCRTNRPLL
jgi:hypothetical protein